MRKGMTLRRFGVPAVSVIAALSVICGAALAARSYPDRVGDVEGGAGPDIVSVAVSNAKTSLTFRVRFAGAPPLRFDQREGWLDGLHIPIDVPPLGPPPVAGGEWRGANFFIAISGVTDTGDLVRVERAGWRRAARFKVVTTGSTVTFSIQRRALGNPAWFTFLVAASRQTVTEEHGGGTDLAPARGSFRYTLTR